MITTNETTAALDKTGSEEFARLTDPFRTELLTYCYRMLGSMEDAEDQVQEIYLRAWRSYAGFEGRSSLRTWLYRIATNVCLNVLTGRSRQPALTALPDDDDPAGQRAARTTDDDHSDPAVIVAAREHRKRALLVVWQHLSPRQRAVLVLRDVLNWQATEIADLLGTSGTAVHSMLRRARAQLAQTPSTAAEAAKPDDLALRRLLDEYAAAFETGDITNLVYLLADDTLCQRRPSNTVLKGRDEIAQYLLNCPAVGNCRMVPISVNGKPGFGVYRRDADGVLRAHTIDVLTVTRSGFERIEVFDDRSLFSAFGLPHVHEADLGR
ncbi:RNA polymerase subunit sigma-70 [Nonomuraea sp. ZG12]|uniref:RNA polymerase subunit sigma-70 n=1 Tax=Nonomuraea sp. ZG12 TaxID=3452207 RepID=UPI003F88C36B